MKFGVFDHLDASGAPLAEFYENRLRLAEAYDRIGIHALHVAEDEMHRVFNCGIGMVVVLSPEQVAAATRVLETEGERVFAIGTIEKGPGGEADCVVA